jgi:hypothetical protein
LANACSSRPTTIRTQIGFEALSQVLASAQLLRQMVRTRPPDHAQRICFLLADASDWHRRRSSLLRESAEPDGRDRALAAGKSGSLQSLACIGVGAKHGVLGWAGRLAACLDFNGALILLPVMRRLLTKVR